MNLTLIVLHSCGARCAYPIPHEMISPVTLGTLLRARKCPYCEMWESSQRCELYTPPYRMTTTPRAAGHGPPEIPPTDPWPSLI